jgi:hypothetical protein
MEGASTASSLISKRKLLLKAGPCQTKSQIMEAIAFGVGGTIRFCGM